MTKKRNGFTLLELLVVISIIGILLAMMAAAFSTAQSRSRDARRRGDIKAMQDSFEQFYSVNNGSYDTPCSDMAGALSGGLPVDPQTQGAYSCNATTTTYCACADLEGSDGNSPDTTCANIGGNTGGFYCLEQRQ